MGDWIGMSIIRFRFWLSDVIDRCREVDELGRIGVIISVLVSWFVMSLAMQSLLYLAVSWAVPDSGEPGVSAMLLGALAPLSSVLAYAPILVFLPFIREKLTGSPLLALPSTKTGSRASRILKTVITGVIFSIIMLIGVQLVGWLVGLVSPAPKVSDVTQDASHSLVGLFHGEVRWPALTMIDLVCVIVIAPVMEELMFRVVVASEVYSSTFATKIGADGSRVATWPRTVMATVVSGFIFAVMHVLTTDPSQWLLVLLTTWLIGSALSWLTCIKTKSTWPGVVAHVSYNALVVLIGVLTLR